MLPDLVRAILRKKTPVSFGDLKRTRPVSSTFGLDRGTPVDRHYIEKFLQRHEEFIQGRVLEIGDSQYSKAFGGERVTAFEVLHATNENPRATIIGDLIDPRSLPVNDIDCFICTQTFNFIYEVEKAAEGAYAVLKPGGTLLATMAGICQISRYDMERWGDYWRFTTASAKKLFEGVFGEGVVVECYGNVLAATALLEGLAVEDLPDPALLDDHDRDYQVVIGVFARKSDK